MSSNVLPSAPDYDETETQTTLYPVLPTQPDNNFRMQKANEVLKYLSDEVSHYRLVAKKYKRTKTIINYASFSAGSTSGFLSAGSIAAAFTVIGAPASIPIGCVASFFGLTAAGLTVFYKKLEPKLIKHCKIMTLALSKCDTVNRILSKSLIDGKISDSEFQSILDENDSYRIQKEILRKGTLPEVKEKQSSPDIEKIRQQAVHEERIRLQNRFLAARSTFRNKISVEENIIPLHKRMIGCSHIVC